MLGKVYVNWRVRGGEMMPSRHCDFWFPLALNDVVAQQFHQISSPDGWSLENGWEREMSCLEPGPGRLGLTLTPHGNFWRIRKLDTTTTHWKRHRQRTLHPHTTY
jgi:hypothetical protein